MKPAATATFKQIKSEIASDVKPVEEKNPIGFRFTGLDSMNRPLKDSVPYKSRQEAEIMLHAAGVKVESLVPFYRKTKLIKRAKMPSRIDMAQLADQFGEMLESGMPLLQVLGVLSDNHDNDIVRKALDDVRFRMERGQQLPDAFLAQETESGNQIFPVTFVYALRIGVDTGEFGSMLRFFSEAQRRAHEIFRAIKKAMIYPICVLVAVFVAFVIEVLWIIPMFATIFEGLLSGKDDSLPLMTQLMLDISSFFRSPFGLILLGALGAGAAWLFYYLFRNPRGIDLRERVALNIPKFGEFYRCYHGSTFCRNLSLMWRCEPNVIQRFQTVAETTTNPRYREMCEHIANQLITQAPPIENVFSGHFGLLGSGFRSVAATIGVSGDGEKQLYTYAQMLEQKAQEKLEVFIAVVENAAIIIPAGFVTLLLVASYLPLFQIISRLADSTK